MSDNGPNQPNRESPDVGTDPISEANRAYKERLLDEELEESFPASDPPSSNRFD